MPVPPITPSKVHDIAETAMQGLLSSDASRSSVEITSRSKGRNFSQELAVEAYDIAEAMIAESEART